jgi:hypothetical protein
LPLVHTRRMTILPSSRSKPSAIRLARLTPTPWFS